MTPTNRPAIIRDRDEFGTAVVRVPLDAKGSRWAILEAADYDALPPYLKAHPWFLNDNGRDYAYVKAAIPNAPGNLVRLHRVVLQVGHGQAVRFLSQDRTDLRRRNMSLRKDGRAKRNHMAEVARVAA